MRVHFAGVLAAVLSVLPWLAPAQNRNSSVTNEHWVTTWATSQDLAAIAPLRGLGRDGPMASNVPATFANQTVRMIVRVSLGGRRFRVELSNMAGARPLEVGAAHLGVHQGGGTIVDGTDRVLTFGGEASFTIPPGVLAVSDPVDLEVRPLSDLAVSLYLPRDTGPPTSHLLGLHTA